MIGLYELLGNLEALEFVFGQTVDKMYVFNKIFKKHIHTVFSSTSLIISICSTDGLPGILSNGGLDDDWVISVHHDTLLFKCSNGVLSNGGLDENWSISVHHDTLLFKCSNSLSASLELVLKNS